MLDSLSITNTMLEHKCTNQQKGMLSRRRRSHIKPCWVVGPLKQLVQVMRAAAWVVEAKTQALKKFGEAMEKDY